jgi:exodeoxyribonuclease-3
MALLKIATWNVNGIRARETQVLEWIERERPDVICLQELKSSVAQVPAALCELQGYRCYWHGARAYSGVSISGATRSPRSRSSAIRHSTLKLAS